MIQWKCDVCGESRHKKMGEFSLMLRPLTESASLSDPYWQQEFHFCCAACRDFAKGQLEKLNLSCDWAASVQRSQKP